MGHGAEAAAASGVRIQTQLEIGERQQVAIAGDAFPLFDILDPGSGDVEHGRQFAEVPALVLAEFFHAVAEGDELGFIPQDHDFPVVA
jgi:hypothetical protein